MDCVRETEASRLSILGDIFFLGPDIVTFFSFSPKWISVNLFDPLYIFTKTIGNRRTPRYKRFPRLYMKLTVMHYVTSFEVKNKFKVYRVPCETRALFEIFREQEEAITELCFFFFFFFLSRENNQGKLFGEKRAQSFFRG